MVPEGADKQRHPRVPRGRPNEGSSNYVDGDAGTLRERRGPGVRRGLLPRVLARPQVASLQDSKGRPGAYIYVYR